MPGGHGNSPDHNLAENLGDTMKESVENVHLDLLQKIAEFSKTFDAIAEVLVKKFF